MSKGKSPIKPPSPKSSSRLSWTAFFYGFIKEKEYKNTKIINFCKDRIYTGLSQYYIDLSAFFILFVYSLYILFMAIMHMFLFLFIYKIRK